MEFYAPKGGVIYIQKQNWILQSLNIRTKNAKEKEPIDLAIDGSLTSHLLHWYTYLTIFLWQVQPRPSEKLLIFCV